MRRPLSTLNPVFYYIIVKVRRFQRYLKWISGGQRFARKISKEPLAHRVYKHQSVLIRKLGESDLTLQYNKVENLKIAIRCLSGITVRPGETFSFCRLVGCATRRKGYLDGMPLSNGEAVAGTGGASARLLILFIGSACTVH